MAEEDLTLSQVTASGAQMDLISELLGAEFLTTSQDAFLSTYMDEYENIKHSLSLLINQYIDEPAILTDLLVISDRMDSTLKTYLQLKGDGKLPIFDGDAVAALEEHELAPPAGLEMSMDHEHAAAPVDDVWEDFEPFECPICFDDIEERQYAFRFLPCQHYYCSGCVQDYLSTSIKEAQVLDLTCCVNDCQSEVTYRQLKQVLEPEVMEKYEQFSFLAALSADPTVCWCPKGCGNALINDDPEGNKKIICTECNHEFCFDCNEDWHIGTCEEYEKWKIDNGLADEEFERWAKENSKPCPECGIAVQKNSGCNHMTCTKCRYQWCWLCSRKYTDRHFDPYNVLGCPGMQSGRHENSSAGKRVGIRILAGAGMVIGAPIALALAIPAAVVAGPIYGGYRLYKWRKNQAWRRNRERRNRQVRGSRRDNMMMD